MPVPNKFLVHNKKEKFIILSYDRFSNEELFKGVFIFYVFLNDDLSKINKTRETAQKRHPNFKVHLLQNAKLNFSINS